MRFTPCLMAPSIRSMSWSYLRGAGAGTVTAMAGKLVCKQCRLQARPPGGNSRHSNKQQRLHRQIAAAGRNLDGCRRLTPGSGW
jgi:hypothetical protein